MFIAVLKAKQTLNKFYPVWFWKVNPARAWSGLHPLHRWRILESVISASSAASYVTGSILASSRVKKGPEELMLTVQARKPPTDDKARGEGEMHLGCYQL